MTNEELKTRFENLDFNVFEPQENHKEQFLEKLEAKAASKKNTKVVALWKPLLSIAAVVAFAVIMFGDQLAGTANSNDADLASVSKEMAETQSFYSTLIASELDKLEAQQTPETKVLIEDTMLQLNTLEADYKKLKTDLVESGQDKRVIFAMVKNFQQRITLLETVLAQLDNLKELKLKDNEDTIL